MATKKIDVEIDIKTNVDPVKAKLIELRRELQNTAEGSADFTNITNQIKELERSLGLTEEQAKDLGDALEAAPNKIDVKGAGQRLRELQKELRNTQAGTARFNELSAEIRDTEDALNAARLRADDFAGALEAAPGPIGVVARGIKQLELATKSWAAALRLTSVGVLVGITAGVTDAISRSEEVKEKFTGTFDQIRKSFDEILVALLPVLDIINAILGAISPLIRVLKPFILIITSTIQVVLEYLIVLVNTLRLSVMSIFSGKARKELFDYLFDISAWGFQIRERLKDIGKAFRDIGKSANGVKGEVKELRKEIETPLTPFGMRRGELFENLKKELEDLQKEAKETYESTLQTSRGFETLSAIIAAYSTTVLGPFLTGLWMAQRNVRFNQIIDFQNEQANLQTRLIENYTRDIDKLNAEALEALTTQLLQFGASRKASIQLAEIEVKNQYKQLKVFIEQAVKDNFVSRRVGNQLLIQLEIDYAKNVKKIRDDIRDADLEAVRSVFAEEKTQIENINDAYKNAQRTLDELRADNLISIEEYNVYRIELQQRYNKALQNEKDRVQAEEDAREAERIARRDEQINQEVDLVNAAQDEIIEARQRSLESETDIFIERQELLLAYAEFARSVELGLNDWSETLKDKAADAEGKRRDRLRKTYKTVALAELAIGSAGAIADIWIKYAQEKAAIALTSVANPALAIIRSRIALIRAISGTTLVGVQTGIAASKIRSEKLGGGSAAGVGGGSGTDSSPLFAGAQRGIPSVAAPQINTGQGINPTQQLADTLSGITNKPIRAYVVSSDISSQQALDRRINRAGTFS
jgi:hypothetical protein